MFNLVVVVLHGARQRLEAQLFNAMVLHSLHIFRLKPVLHSLLCHMFRLALTCACVVSACRLVRTEDDNSAQHLVQQKNDIILHTYMTNVDM